MVRTEIPTHRERLLLVGSGHTHLYLLTHADSLLRAGYDVTLLAPATFDYSGVASATAAGALPEKVGRIDVRRLAAVGSVEQHEGVLSDLDLSGCVATTGDDTPIAYDVVSFNIGSAVAPLRMGVEKDVVRVKPLDGLMRLDALLKKTQPSSRVTVVGAGSSGLELASQLSLRPDVGQVTLLDAEPDLGRELPHRARSRVRKLLDVRGVDVRLSQPIHALSNEVALGADDFRVEHDVAILATGLAAPSIVSDLGLGDRDGIPVLATLQHRDHKQVYAVGDCAYFLPGPLPRVGVHGVRQGPVLLASLLARRSGRQLPTYTPQETYLSILDLGGGVGLAVRGPRWWCGRSALWLKRWIDRRWLATYQG